MRFPVYRARRLPREYGLAPPGAGDRAGPDGFYFAVVCGLPGHGVRQEISSMPGQYHLSVDQTVEEVRSVADLGIPAVLLFGLPEAERCLRQ